MYLSEEAIVFGKKVIRPYIVQVPLETFALQPLPQRQSRPDLLFISKPLSVYEIR